MSKITIIASNTVLSGAKQAIKKVGQSLNDFSCSNLIIVPDRFSLIAEKLIFSELNTNCTVNTFVMGINKLASSLIEKSNLSCLTCDSRQSILLTRRAMQKQKDNFLCFGKNVSFALSQQIQQTLSLLRSSGATSDSLINFNSSEQGLKNKMHDLGLILAEYEKLLDGRMDATEILNTFSALIASTDEYKNTNFYFVGFDSLTAQGYSVVFNLMQKCKSFTIATLCPIKQNNSHIYDTEMFERILAYSKEKNLDYSVENFSCGYAGEREHILNNLYAFRSQKQNNNNYVKVFSTIEDKKQIELVACEINQKVKFNGYKFSDFAICASEEYHQQIQNIFSHFDISYYIDSSFGLDNCLLSSFIKKIIVLFENYFTLEDVVAFLNNDYVLLEKSTKNNIENYILENAVYGRKILELDNIFEVQIFGVLFEFYNKISKSQTVSEYCAILKQILEYFNTQQTTDDLAVKFEQNGDLFLQKTYIQLYDKIIELIDCINELIGDEKSSLGEFFDIFNSALENEKINSVPASCDCVMIGDMEHTFFEECKTMFIIGANEGVLPVVLSDSGLVSDKDISNFECVVKVEPTVRMINKRNKFKMFEILLLGKENLFITYKSISSDSKQLQPSTFINSLKKCLNFEIEKVNNSYYDINPDKEFENLIKFNPTPYYAKLEMIKNNNYSPIIKKALVLSGNDDVEFENNERIIKNAKKLFFKNNTTKVSQIEKYFACPMAHFYAYGLKLKEPKTATLQANDFGNVLHRLSELFVKNNCSCLANMTQEQIVLSVTKIMDYLAKNEYKMLELKDNEFYKKLLTEEAVRFCSFVCDEQSHSLFKPNQETLEMRFGKGKKHDSLKLDVDGETFEIVGAIDRVDIYKDYFRIIDYKTGSLGADSAKFSALYYGNKIQIFVYLKATENALGKKAFGVFYLPISNAFAKPDEDKYKMKGFLIDNYDLAYACDDELIAPNKKSRFIEAGLKTKNKQVINALTGTKIVSEKAFDNMTLYSLEITKQAMSEILKGYIDSSPFVGSCQYCPYKTICQFSESLNTERKPQMRVTKSNFEGEL